MQNKALIKEIFSSLQGEGPYIGYNQLFIRFAKCNLKCEYCDTDFLSDLKEYSCEELTAEINKYNNFHSVSLTGGEPLLFTDFLLEFLPQIKHKIYLETNATLFENLKKIIEYVDIISADIKLHSSSQNGDLFRVHDKFFEIAKNCGKEIFAKVVFDENIADDEIDKICSLAEKYNLPIVLQPKMESRHATISSNEINDILNKFLNRYSNVRVIAQMHKYLNIR